MLTQMTSIMLIYMCTCVYVHVCVCVCLCVVVCVCLCVCHGKYTYLHVCVHTYVYTCIHAYMYTCLCAGNESFGICADSRVIRSLYDSLLDSPVEGMYQEPFLQGSFAKDTYTSARTVEAPVEAHRGSCRGWFGIYVISRVIRPLQEPLCASTGASTVRAVWHL